MGKCSICHSGREHYYIDVYKKGYGEVFHQTCTIEMKIGDENKSLLKSVVKKLVKTGMRPKRMRLRKYRAIGYSTYNDIYDIPKLYPFQIDDI